MEKKPARSARPARDKKSDEMTSDADQMMASAMEDGEGGRPGSRRSNRPSRELVFDYKDTDMLKRFMTEYGKIVPRRVNKLNAYQQRELTKAVKRARQLALLPFETSGVR